MNMLKLAGLLVTATVATGAQAASVVNLSAGTQSVSLATATSKNLSNNSAAYRSGASPLAYVFDEGSNLAATNATTQALGIAGATVQSFLLHYDRANGGGLFGGLTTGTASGSFSIQLGANEFYAGLVGVAANLAGALSAAQALTATDPATGATYPATVFNGSLFRGTEGSALGDFVNVSTAGNLVNVSYQLTSNGLSLDEARFFVGTATAAVPEPATWAMMIGGFGLAAGALRRQRRAFAFA